MSLETMIGFWKSKLCYGNPKSIHEVHAMLQCPKECYIVESYSYIDHFYFFYVNYIDFHLHVMTQ
jgi:hypothetical protein